MLRNSIVIFSAIMAVAFWIGLSSFENSAMAILTAIAFTELQLT